jgi:hypothetical protein
MIILETEEVLMPESFEVRIYFKGYITPETLQDARNNSYGFSYEALGKMFDEELKNERTS